MTGPLYPSQDGPGAGAVVEVVVRVMVGPDRSTVVVRRVSEPAILHEVRPQGAEADGLGASVEAAVREGLARLLEPPSARTGWRAGATVLSRAPWISA